MNSILDAITAQAPASELARLPLPDRYRALTIRKEDVAATRKIPVAERDPRATLRVQEVPVPELVPDEVLVAVMASSINFNTVWSALFEPVPTFTMIEKYARRSPAWQRHDRPYHQLGSDACGVVLRVGAGVGRHRPGDRVIVHGAHVDLEGPEGHGDAMLDPSVVAWGYETNFGGLGELAVAKAHQLLPKPRHLTWEEAACNGVTNSTTYRQLISQNGAGMKQGDIVLVWGAASGMGSYAVQYALNGGAYPVAVVSGARRTALVRAMGCEWVIDRQAEGFVFTRDGRMDPAELRRFGQRVRDLTGGEDPSIVFEHVGRDTFSASVYVAARGGRIVTSGSTSGYEHVYDNRHLWLGLKQIRGTHIANLREAWEANRLVCRGAIHPTLSVAVPLEKAGEATRMVQQNQHDGKVGVLCLVPTDGLGVEDHELRQRHLARINRFRREDARLVPMAAGA